MHYFLTFSLLLLSFHSSAQATDKKTNDPYTNAVILSHYEIPDLKAIEESDPAKFKSICYYYTATYIVEKLDCTDCITFDPSTFDVSNYESKRKKSERYVHEFHKSGFRLTLLSFDELQYKLPVQIARFSN